MAELWVKKTVSQIEESLAKNPEHWEGNGKSELWEGQWEERLRQQKH